MTAQARSRGSHRAAMIVRLVRYAIYILVGVMLWTTISTYSFVRINEDDVSVVGVSGINRLLVERFDGDELIERGDILVFGMLDAMDQPFFRVSRVVAVPGDVIDESDGFFTLNGEKLDIPVRARKKAPGPMGDSEQQEPRAQKDLTGRVPEGFYLLLNDNPLSEYPDSRRIGLIDRNWVIGRFLGEMPF